MELLVLVHWVLGLVRWWWGGGVAVVVVVVVGWGGVETLITCNYA